MDDPWKSGVKLTVVAGLHGGVLGMCDVGGREWAWGLVGDRVDMGGG